MQRFQKVLGFSPMDTPGWFDLAKIGRRKISQLEGDQAFTKRSSFRDLQACFLSKIMEV